ncbi:MAG: pirin family protein [Candidatus Marsarchaeota archaeon]|nr:pirin family protein [Candidatus Marsarchaeota archaeon]
MTGPTTPEDLSAFHDDRYPSSRPAFELFQSRRTTVGNITVRRALPKRQRRTIGAWCFADHFGPELLSDKQGMDVGPHPHIGLQTATWLLEGELVHRDSLGSEQTIRPGELNLMTAGKGVSHSEESPGKRSSIHGIQLWIAQPNETRNGEPAFEHHNSLPEANIDNATATVLVGSFGGATSSARSDTPIVGVQVTIGIGSTILELRKDFEYGLIVLEGIVTHQNLAVTPGNLAYFPMGRNEIMLTSQEPSILMLLGGKPFSESLLMWWNFVARTHGELDEARQDWNSHSQRFGIVNSKLDSIPAPTLKL